MKTVIGLFQDELEAKRAYTALLQEGYARADLDILTRDDKDDEPKLAHMREWVPKPDIDIYLEGVARGGTIVTANVADSAVGRAAGTMAGYNMVNIKHRAAELQKDRRDLTPLSDPAKSENVLEVIEEELQVGKEAVERGRMRIYNVVTERQATQDVGLRDETIRVQRRPVNRQVSINPDLFKERSYEMVERFRWAKRSRRRFRRSRKRCAVRTSRSRRFRRPVPSRSTTPTSAPSTAPISRRAASPMRSSIRPSTMAMNSPPASLSAAPRGPRSRPIRGGYGKRRTRAPGSRTKRSSSTHGRRYAPPASGAASGSV